MRKLLFFLAIACYGQLTPSVVAPDPQQQWLNAQGKPFVGAFLCTFIAGSSTPIVTYVNSMATTTNTNPIVLDATGSATIWILPNVLYKYVLYVGGNGSCPGSGAPQWTRDFISTSSAGSAAIIPGSYPIGPQLTYLRSKPNVVTPILEYVSPPQLYSSDYVFSQTPGGTLSPGTVTITLTPVPLGINHTDTKHYLWLSGGTGGAEGCLINGGTAISGATSGTITCVISNSHSGAWTISTPTCGATEAEYAAPVTGATISIMNSCTVKAPIPYMDFMTFSGAAGGTWLTSASSSGIIFDSNVPSGHVNNGLNGTADLVTFQNLVLNGQPFDGVNTIYGIRNLLPGGSGDTQPASISDVNIVNVSCNNVANCLYFQRAWNVYSTNLKLFGNSKVFFGDVSGLDAFSPFNTTNIVMKETQSSTYCIKNDCTPGASFTGGQLTFSHSEGVTVKNAVLNGARTSQSSGVGAITFEGGEASVLDNVLVEQCDLCINYKPYTGAGHTIYPNSAILTNSTITQPYSVGVFIDNGTGLGPVLNGPTGFTITNNQFTLTHAITPASVLLEFGAFSNNITVVGNTFQSGANTSDWVGAEFGNNSNGIIATNNTFQNTGAGSGNNASGMIFGTATTNVIYNNNTFQDMTALVSDSSMTIASASTITIPGGRSLYPISGSTAINNINTCDATHNTNQTATFLFGAAGQVNTTGNVHLGSTFGPITTRGTLTLLCTSTSGWYEVSRFVN